VVGTQPTKEVGDCGSPERAVEFLISFRYIGLLLSTVQYASVSHATEFSHLLQDIPRQKSTPKKFHVTPMKKRFSRYMDM
jgi:hypothetical protein